jgi:hypothetical protein
VSRIGRAIRDHVSGSQVTVIFEAENQLDSPYGESSLLNS